MPLGMINCKEYARLVSNGMDRPLSFWDRISLKIHKLICTPCSRIEAHFLAIRSACRWLPSEDAAPDDSAGRLPEDVRARIKARLSGHSR